MEDKATVLVTGGTGFVARQIILQLLQKGYRVRTTVRNLASITELKDTPSRWLVRKRLQEAYFLVQSQGRKPTDIYLELGFESLSHFSVAFKKEFGIVPTSLKMNNRD